MPHDPHEPAGSEKPDEDRKGNLEAPADGGNGLSTGLQPRGTLPSGGPGARVGSIGRGGGSTAGVSTGNAGAGG